MMTTASSAAAEVRGAPTTRRHPEGRTELPHRTQSLATKSGSQSRSSSAQAPKQGLKEQTSLAEALPRPSNDYHTKGTDSRAMNAARIAMQQSPRIPDVTHPPRNPATPATNNGNPAEDAARSSTNAPSAQRRRTEVKAQTGTWSLQKTIGQGSMGKVKLAKNQESGEVVAIKIIPRQSTDEHRSQADRERADHSKEIRTAREAAIVTLLNHPFICGMRDVVRTNYHWYMLFEYVNGGQMLDYIISHGRLKEKQARKFARQIASALDYCHRNSIVHRDLKIENILISKEGNIKIIDFGLSNLFAPKSLLKTFCGSLYFAAPELLQAKAYLGPEVDVWSFGIVLYVLVCGKVPFDDQSMPQLHAKIKKGLVEYPPWLSTECRHLISRMLVTDPKTRATLTEIMSHPWMNKGFDGPTQNHLPPREPLQLPLDKNVINKMTGFDFGPADYITSQLEAIIGSEDYQKAVQQAAQRAVPVTNDGDRKKSGMFDFLDRKKPSASAREALSNASAETIDQMQDPVNAFHPLISVYYLVREKQEREKTEENPGALSMPQSPGEKPLQLPNLPAPKPAVTNSAAYEMQGEEPTGGRARPRARTHGEDEMKEQIEKAQQSTPATPAKPVQVETTPAKKEGGFGILRRFSTRRGRNTERDKPMPLQTPTPTVEVSEAATTIATPSKLMSVRKTRDKDAPPPSSLAKYANHHPELLSPPIVEMPEPLQPVKSRGLSLGRSTSINTADLRRRFSRRGTSEGRMPQQTSQRDTTTVAGDGASDNMPNERSSTSRTKSTGNNAPRESMQLRRNVRDQNVDADLPEETDAELATYATQDAHPIESQENIKPVYLKGLFSVSTTSSKPLSYIRTDIIRVLRDMGIEFREIKGGFTCRSNADVRKPVDSPQQEPQPRASMALHRRRISFAGLRGGGGDHRDKDHEAPTTPKTPRRPILENGSNTNSEESDEEAIRRHNENNTTPPKLPGADATSSRLPAGETTTHVQNDMNQGMEMVFEILVVKVPLLSLHGLQFKKVDGNTWQYKQMADRILGALKL